MRIALVVDPLTLGSRGGRHAPALAQALIDRGHEVRGFGAPPGKVPHSVDYHELNGLTRFNAQALIAYDGLSPTAFSAARVARKSGVPLILVEPGPLHGKTPLHERLAQGIGERLWGGYVRSAAAAVVAIDPVARDLALGEGFEPDRIHVIPAGVDLDLFNPSKARPGRVAHGLRGRVILYAGPLETSIGLEGMIRAFARTLGRHPDWTLALLGSGSGKRSLRTMVARLGVSANVHWIEVDNPEDEAGVFASATAFANPALNDHATARWMLSAMASGVPIVCSDIARFNWAVDHEKNGLLVAVNDEPAWEAGLTRLASAPVARKRWGANARTWAESELDWSTIVIQFENMCAAASVGEDAAQGAGELS